jgi:SAM-dependent methyltransferase
MSSDSDPASLSLPCAFDAWIADLEARHLRDMTTAEVARALRALSSTYVERRARLGGRGAFDTAGKRAAYALYYAPRRFLMTAHLVRHLAAPSGPLRVIDLGCGTGAAGAAWACAAGAGSSLTGLDTHPWAIEEARAAYRTLRLDGTARRGTAVDATWRPRERSRGAATRMPMALVLSYVANELADDARAALLPQLLAEAAAGARVPVMEPITRKTSPWWPAWTRAVVAAGGRQDEWRLRIAPPPITEALGRAAGLDAHEATGRTLWLGPG